MAYVNRRLTKANAGMVSIFTRMRSAMKVVSSGKKFEGKPLAEFFDNYRLKKEALGAGASSQVKLAFDRDGKPFAVKILNKDSLNPQNYRNIIREVNLMKTLIHPNIVRFWDFYEDENAIYVVMEYASGGELFKEIEKRDRYTEHDAKEVVLLLAHALKYCYEKGIVHRDIKPDNILLQDMAHGKKVLLADFGFATKLDPNLQEFTLLQTQCGTPNYVAPEIIDGRPYNYKCDIWSFGVVVFVMMSGYLPFGGNTKRELFRNIRKAELKFLPKSAWANVSEDAKDFIQRLACKDPDERYDYDQILKHPWLTKKEEGSENNITENLLELKKFNHRRKLYAANKAMEAAEIFRELMGRSISGLIESDDPKMVEMFEDAMDYEQNAPVPLVSSRNVRKAVDGKTEEEEESPKQKRQEMFEKKTFFSFWRTVKTDN